MGSGQAPRRWTGPGLDAAPEHAERVADVLARAMENDPLNLHAYPDPRRRRRALRAMYRLIAGVAIRSRAVRLTSPAAEGLAIWDRPGRRAFRGLHLAGAGVLRSLAAMGLRSGLFLGRYEAWAAGLMSTCAPPRAAHLILLAVDPSEQGRGWAAMLVRSALSDLDAWGIPACLETQNPANVPIYEHLGFRVAARGVVPGTRVRHWVMVRP